MVQYLTIEDLGIPRDSKSVTFFDDPQQGGTVSIDQEGSLLDIPAMAIDLFEDTVDAAEEIARTPTDEESLPPSWATGEISPRHHKRLFLLRQSALEPGISDDEYEQRAREAQMFGAMVKAKQQIAQQEHQEFLESGLDPEAYYRKQELDRISDQYFFGPMHRMGTPGALARGVESGAIQLGGAVTSMLSRVVPGLGNADEHNRVLQQLEQDQILADEGLAGESATLRTGARRGLQSTVEMLPAVALGGLPGVIGYAGASSANQAYTEAIDSGLGGSQALAYAAGSGAIEGGLTWLFGKMGLSAEELLSASVGRSAGRSFAATGMRQAMGSIVSEGSEEAAIAFSQAVLDRIAGVDADALQPNRLIARMSEAGLAGAFGGGYASLLFGATRARQTIEAVEQLENEDAMRGFLAGLDSNAEAPPDTSRKKFIEATGIKEASKAFREGFAKAVGLKQQQTTPETEAEPTPQPPGEEGAEQTRSPAEDPAIEFDPEKLQKELDAENAAREAEVEALVQQKTEENRAHAKELLKDVRRALGNRNRGIWRDEGELTWWHETIDEMLEVAPSWLASAIEAGTQEYEANQSFINDIKAQYVQYLKSTEPVGRYNKKGELVYRTPDALASWRMQLKHAGGDPGKVKGFDSKLDEIRNNAPELLAYKRDRSDTDESALVNLIMTPNEELFPKLSPLDFIDKYLLEFLELPPEKKASFERELHAPTPVEEEIPYDQGVLSDADKGGRRRQPKPEPPPLPSGEVGEFLTTEATDIQQPEVGSDGFPLDRLVHVPIPELVEMAENLGAVLKAMKLPDGTRGQFASKLKEIRIAKALAKSPAQFAKTLAHEIGHFLDYLPDETLKRGNLLGRLAALKGYRKQALDGRKDSEIREELKQVSFWWRPFDERIASETHKRYRNSGVELYADALSVFLNAPGELQQRAPKFFDGLLQYMERKPELLEAYVEFQQMLQGRPEEVQRHRRDLIMRHYRTGEEKILAAEEAERRARESPIEALWQDGFAAAWSNLKRKLLPSISALVVDRGAQAIANQKAAGRTDPMAKGINAYRELDALQRIDGVSIAWMQRFKKEVGDPLLEAGLDTRHLGYLLQMRRIINDRNEVMNPQGYLPEHGEQGVNYLRDDLGEEKFNRLREVADRFYDMVFEVGQKALDAGLITPDLWHNTIVPNSDSYAAFGVLHHMDNHVSWAIRQVQGTLAPIGNPAQYTAMKMVAMIRAAELNVIKKNVLTGHLMRDAPELIRVVNPKTDPSKVQPGNERVTFLKEGQPVTVEVPRYYADLFDTSDSSWPAWQMAHRFMNSMTYGIFYPLYITFSASFAARNPFRDFERTYHLAGTMVEAERQRRRKEGEDAPPPLRWHEIIRRMIANLPDAHKRAMERHSDKVVKMLEAKSLDVQYTRRARHEMRGFLDDETVRKIMREAGMMPTNKASRYMEDGLGALQDVVPKFLWGFMPRYWIDLGEAASKMAAFDAFQDRGFTLDETAYLVNNFSSTPNTRLKGLGADGLNAMSMFTSVQMANLRAHAQAMRASPKEYAKRLAIITTADLVVNKAVRMGVFGTTLAYLYSLIPEDLEDRYHVLPLWLTRDPEDGQDKVVMLSIPRDYSSSLAYATQRRLADAAFETGQMDWEGLFQDAWSETLGTLSPPFDMGMRWSEYAHGHQPYDSYFHRPIVSSQEMRRGGWPAHRKMLAWTLKKFGAAETVLKPIASPVLGEAMEQGTGTTLESSLRSVPYFSALLQVTNRGLDEDLYRRAQEADNKNDAVGRMVDLESQRMSSRYHLLGRAKETLTPREQKERARMHWWYQQVYLPYRGFMREEVQLGQEDRAREIAEQLKRVSAQVREIWKADDRGDEAGVKLGEERLQELLTSGRPDPG